MKPPRTDDPRVDSWIRIGLLVAAFAPFIGTLFYGFVYDDNAIILHNPVLVGWKSVFEVWRHPYWIDADSRTPGLYRPLLTMCFAVLANGAHKFAIAYHLFAVMLHAIATLLVAKLLRRGVGRWPAAGAALWFALHPVHVEAVASVANVSEVLVCVWTLALALWLLPPAPTADERLRAPEWGRAMVAALLYTAALFSKESGVVAPGLALLAVIGWGEAGTPSPRDARTRARGWGRVIMLWLVALASVVVIRRLVLGGVTGHTAFEIPGLKGLGALARIQAVLSTGGRVLQLLVWPTAQTPDYGPSVLPVGIERTLAAAATVSVLFLVLLWSSRLAFRGRRDARPLVAILWCLVAYLPASNLLAATGAIIAERTLYLASVGVAMLLAWILDRAAAYAAARSDAARAVPSRVTATIPALATLGVIAICARGYVATHEYARVWRDHRSLFSRIVQVDSLDYRGYQLLAITARAEHRYDEADRLYARAYALRPFEPTLLTAYGQYLLEMRRPRYALAIGERLLRDHDSLTDPDAVTLVLNATARVWGVDSVLEVARRLNVRAPSARAALFVGMAYDVKGDSAAAQAAYRAGLRAAPADSALNARVAPRGGTR